MHSPYSPDLALSDYHLIHSLENHLNEKHYQEDDDIYSDLTAFFASKSPDFYKRGFDQLPKRWAVVVDTGDYIVD